jgi:DNA replicative helicase MCM subunit Mcm2 (Cdc46/Mcm family)
MIRLSEARARLELRDEVTPRVRAWGGGLQ